MHRTETATLDLVERSARGDGDACSRLVQRHDRLLRSTVRGGRSSPFRGIDTEDLAQETWCRVFRGNLIRSFCDARRGAFGRLLQVIIRGVLVDSIRRMNLADRAERAMSAGGVGGDSDARVCSPQMPSVEFEELRDLCLRVLGPGRFDLIWRVDVVGEDQRTAAERLGVPFGTLRARLSAARREMRAALELRDANSGRSR